LSASALTFVHHLYQPQESTMSITSSRLARTGLGAILGGATALALAGPASAATPTAAATPAPAASATGARATQALADLQAKGAAAIAQRQAQLVKLSGRLSAAPGCDSSGAIAAELAADGPALTAIGAKLAADTTLATARVDYQTIFGTFRIYLVVTPQVYATSACGRVQRVTTKLNGDQAKLSARVDAAAAAGADMTAAKAALADMTSKDAAATTLANQAASSLAGIAPDGGNKTIAAANAAAVTAARSALKTAEADLQASIADGKTVVAALKAAKTTSTTTAH
jgi:hypothetical protein